MTFTFIVILVALLVERFFNWSHLRQWNWYGVFERKVMEKFPGASPYVILGATILPPVFGLLVMQLLFSSMAYGFPWLLVQLVVVLYCLGPKNLWADAFASITSLTSGSAQAAADTLKSTFNVKPTNQPGVLQQELTSQIVIAANERVFAVIFWYGFLGAPGALLYRMVSVSAETMAGSELGVTARYWQDVLDWLPARALTFCFALGGNFTRVLSCWRQRVSMGLEGNALLMTECGLAAITSEGEKYTEDGSLERHAVSMLDRVFIIVLVVSLLLCYLL